jgi:uncharacterized protein YggE
MNFFVACAILMGTLAPVSAQEALRTVTVTGQGTVEAVPDMATVQIGVTREARLADEALDATSEAVAGVIARLQAAGIDPRDMQTQGVSLYPVRDRDGDAPTVIGFVARNSLAVRVRALDALGPVLNAVVEDGANTLSSLQFSLADTDAALAEARADAVGEAMAKAAQLAAAAGISLGPVLSITESGSVPRPMMMEMATSRMADDVPVARGEVSITAQVTVVFEISDG